MNRRWSLLGCSVLLLSTVAAEAPSGSEILARIESENSRRHSQLKEYSGNRQYTMQNTRFGMEAAVAVLMNYRQSDGQRYTVVSRSGSDKLNGIIDQVIASERVESQPPESTRRDITAANYRARLLAIEVAAKRSCYVVELTPRIKNRFLIVGKVWVDTESFAVVRIEGQFAASVSILLGAPRLTEDFIEVQGYWLPAHVKSVTSSLLLGPTELEILFSNYQLDQDSAPQQ